jgi:hypothetical protein
MYLDRPKLNGEPIVPLREPYREGGKAKKRGIANPSP